MKKLFNSRLCFAALGLFILVAVPSCNATPKLKRNIDYTLNEAGNDEKVYSIKNHYVYRVQDPFTKSPDTFEAWVNVPADSAGGTIAGNYMFDIGTVNDVTVEWNVDIFGHINLVWGCKGLNYTFNDATINDGEWHHVAVTRNPSTHQFSCLIDGVNKGSVTSRQKDAVEPMAMCIGSSYRNWTTYATPLNGKIREVSFYNACLTEQEIASDFAQGSGINPTQRENCLATFNLGEKWTKRLIESSVGDNLVYLASQDKYVPVADTPEFDYTILGLPDVQTMVDFPQDNWDANNTYMPMMQWVADNIEEEKIKFAIQVGDLVDDGSSESAMFKAYLGFDLWEGKLPFSTVPGNHDYTDNCLQVKNGEGIEQPTTRDLKLFNDYFGETTASQFKEFGGTFDGGIENSYYLFEVDGIKYLNINLEFFPRMKVIRWAGRLCEQFPDRRVIVNTHYYTDYYGRISGSKTAWGPSNYSYFQKYNECTQGTDLWEGLIKRYKNIFMTISGHFSVEDAVVTNSVGDNGNPIINVLIDQQCSNHWNAGRSWLVDPIDSIMLMKFNESKKEIYFRYYSPKHDAVYNLQNQFTLSFKDWQEPLEANYEA